MLDAELKIRATIDSEGVVRGLTNINKEMQTVDNTGRNVDKTTGMLSNSYKSFTDTVFKAVVAIKALNGAFMSTVQAASDINEENNKLSELFSSSGQAAIDEVNAIVELTRGMGAFSERGAKQAIASLSDLTLGFGLSSETALQFSRDLVPLAADLASFKNLQTGDVLRKFQSALVGEFEPLKQIGIVINESVLKQKALEEGIKAVNGTLRASDKAFLVHKIIMEQTQTAQGDFQRTSHELANTMRRAEVIFEDIGTTIGRYLIPLFTPVINGIVQTSQAFKDFIEDTGNFGSITNTLATAFNFLKIIFETLIEVGRILLEILSDLGINFDMLAKNTDTADTALGIFKLTLESIVNTLRLLIQAIVDTIKSLWELYNLVKDVLNPVNWFNPNALKQAFNKFNDSALELMDNFKKNTIKLLRLDKKDQKSIIDSYKEARKKIKEEIEASLLEGKKVSIKPMTDFLGLSDKQGGGLAFQPQAVKLQEIKVDLLELQKLTDKVNEGSALAAAQYLKYYDPLIKLEKKRLQDKTSLTKEEQKAYEILKATTPKIKDNLKVSSRSIEYERVKNEYSKDYLEALEKEIDLKKTALSETEREIVNSLNLRLTRGKTSEEALKALDAEIAKNQQIIDSGNAKKRTYNDLNFALKKKEELLQKSQGLQIQREELTALEKAKQQVHKLASAYADLEVIIKPAVMATENLFKAIESGVSGDAAGLGKNIMNMIANISAAVNPVLGKIVGIVNTVISSIVDLAFASQKAKFEQEKQKLEAKAIEIEHKIQEMKAEMESLEKRFNQLQNLNQQQITKRDAQRALYEAELIRQGYSELEIKKKLQEYDRNTHKERLKQIEEEKKQNDKNIENLRNKIKKAYGIDIVDAQGNLDKNALDSVTRREEQIAKKKRELDTLYKQISSRNLVDWAGTVTGGNEQAAQEFQRRFNQIMGKTMSDVWDFGKWDVETLKAKIKNALDSTNILGLDEKSLKYFDESINLSKEQAELQLELIKKEQELIKQQNEYIIKQMELLEKYKNLGGSLQKERQLALGALMTGSKESLQTTTSNANTNIGVQIINNKRVMSGALI